MVSLRLLYFADNPLPKQFAINAKVTVASICALNVLIVFD
jgi:hypothetical protein